MYPGFGWTKTVYHSEYQVPTIDIVLSGLKLTSNLVKDQSEFMTRGWSFSRRVFIIAPV